MTSKKDNLIKIGAEARVRSSEWRGRKVVIKHRVPKGYRHPNIDACLRQQRTKGEARLLALAREAGVRTPIIFDVDLDDCTIIMERIDGRSLKDVLAQDEGRAEILHLVGREVARLHRSGIIHGDLTGNNIVALGDLVQFIDLGLGERTSEIEAMGVDLHVLEEALEVLDLGDLFKEVEAGYLEEWPKGKEVIVRLKDISRRGRYT